VAYRSKKIEERKIVLEILQWCLENETIFETTDAYGNLIRLRLDAILRAESGIKRLFMHSMHLILPMSVRTSPYCSPTLSRDHIYTIFFHFKGTTYSIEGKLADSNSGNLSLKFIVPYTLVQHRKRKWPRISTRNFEEIKVSIEEEAFELSDISLSGVGIIVGDKDRFQPGQIIKIQLVIQDFTFNGQGSVEHITPLSKGKFVCGINIEYSNEGSLCSIQQILHGKGSREGHQV